METAVILLCVVVVLTLIFDFINGFHDAANAIATVVSTRVMRPTTAVLYGGILNFAGALLGTEVAATIGKGLVDANAISLQTVMCTVLAAIVWNLITWYKGLPTSSSHAIIGSLMGATFASTMSGHSIIWPAVYKKVLIPMVASPLMGLFIGFMLMALLTWVVYRMNPGKINRIFGKLQIVSAGFMALSHGHNDAQKSMGIIALALVLAFPGQDFHVPLWVIITCAIAMGLGTMCGGWRIIRTLGSKMIKLQPVHGFAAETTASLIIAGASHWGIPVSTTQVISSSILGVGATRRLSAVRWGIVGNIIWAWVLTIPLTFIFAAIFMLVAKALFPAIV
ncbi:MAG TPA: inorganic phosphate transporter [Alphaproteobacteria bacterium]|nr:inorganic phosphate transporter [Micavibrio sp.]HQX27232.1 inorganic phosphate transporter [Alphaproteobacteria bacterium]